MSSANAQTSPARNDQRALLLLSAASGATDAFAFLCLGKVFAGVMTGNLVLVGASVGAGDRTVVPRAVTALAGYALGVGGAALAEHRLNPRLSLGTETVLLALAAAVWALGLAHSLGSQLALLVALSVAMGVQAHTWGTPTTYFTGTFTKLAGRLARRAPGGSDRWVAVRLAAVVAGAAASSLVAWWWPGATGTVAAVLCAIALAIRPRQPAPNQG